MANRILPLLLSGIMMLTGCAALKNTPQQDAVYSAWHQCEYEGRIPGNLQLVRVEPDGRYWYEWRSSAYGSANVQGCIREKVRAGR